MQHLCFPGSHRLYEPGIELAMDPALSHNPDYNKENIHNDIVLLKANHHVSPGSECSVAGWGQTGVNTTTDRLQEVEQEVVSDRLCRDRYHHDNPITMLPPTKKSAFQ
ncbi:unnamed protein product [Eretmochelys imbricata]